MTQLPEYCINLQSYPIFVAIGTIIIYPTIKYDAIMSRYTHIMSVIDQKYFLLGWNFLT